MHEPYFHLLPIISLMSSIIKIDKRRLQNRRHWLSKRTLQVVRSLCLEGCKNSLTISPTDSRDKITDP